MNGQWEPGDVAMRKGIGGKGEERTVVTQSPGCRDNHCRDPHWHHAGGGWDPIESHPLSTYRPLVVIDPEDTEALERLVYALAKGSPNISRRFRDDVQAALREYARPTPPRPAEPQRLGAVVEDEQGERYVRVPEENEGRDRTRVWVDSQSKELRWSDFDAVRVLSQGVTP